MRHTGGFVRFSIESCRKADEFLSFTSASVPGMLREMWKYRISLVLAHQYLSQLDPQVRDAILGNAGVKS